MLEWTTSPYQVQIENDYGLHSINWPLNCMHIAVQKIFTSNIKLSKHLCICKSLPFRLQSVYMHNTDGSLILSNNFFPVFLGSMGKIHRPNWFSQIFERKYHLGQVSQYGWDTFPAFIREFFVHKILHGHGDIEM